MPCHQAVNEAIWHSKRYLKWMRSLDDIAQPGVRLVTDMVHLVAAPITVEGGA